MRRLRLGGAIAWFACLSLAAPVQAFAQADITWYRDADVDTYGDAGVTTTSPTQPAGYVADDTDCDDTSATTNPGASETWYDGVDQDCRGDNDYDQDADGYSSDSYGGVDCDDLNRAINPGATEISDNGIDEDCDGTDLVTVVPGSDLEIKIEESSDPVAAGSGDRNLVHVIRLNNLGPLDATNISVSASFTIPSGVTVAQYSFGGGSALTGQSFVSGPTTQTVTWTIPSLAAADSNAMGFSFTVEETAEPAINAITVSASIVSSDNADGDSSNDSVTETTSISPPPDTTSPTAVAQDVTVQLGDGGVASITAQEVDDGSSDDVGIVSYALDRYNFECGNVGSPVPVTLTVSDAAGNSASDIATITVEDNVAPIAKTIDTNIQLDASGNASITASDVNGGSTDACGIASLSVSQSNFSTADLGDNLVTLFVTDVNGNVSSATSTVTVTEAPETTVNDDIATGSLTISQVTNPTGAAQSFAFMGDLGSFSLMGGDSRTFPDLDAGPYMIAQSPVSGWAVEDISCDGGNPDFSLATGTVTLDLAGTDVQCTYTTTDVHAPAVTINGAPASITELSPFVVTVDFTEGVYGFVPGDVTVTNATVTGFTGSDGSASYSVEITPTGGGNVTIDVAGAVAKDEAGNDNEAATQVVVGVDTVPATTGMIGAMQELRSKLILEHGPDLQRRLCRLNGNCINNGGVNGFGLAYANDNLPFAVTLGKESASFAYSLRNARAKGGRQGMSGDIGGIARSILGAPQDYRDMKSGNLIGANTKALAYSGSLSAAERQALGMDNSLTPATAYGLAGSNQNGSAGDGAKPLPKFGDMESDAANGSVDPMTQRYDLWVEGEYTKFNATAGDGTFGILHAGADYLVTKDVLVGLGTQFDWIDMDAATGPGTAGGWGFMVGPYMTAKLADGLYLDARGAWGQASNQVSPFGTYEDDFGSERWLATAALIGEFTAGALTISPEARLSWFNERSDAYVDSLSNAIPSVEVETGTFEFGPTISRRIAMEDGVVFVPFTTLTGIWTFEQGNTATAVSGQPGLAEEGVRGRVEAGFDVANDNGLSVSVSGHYDGIGDNGFEAYGGKARIGQRF